MARDPSWVARCRPPRGSANAVRHVTDPTLLASFLSDAAHVPGGFTAAASIPESEAAIAALLTTASTVLPIGAQSSLTGGATPRGEHVLSMASFQEIDSGGSDAVVVGAGVVHAELGRALASRRRWYPPAPTYDGASVGGTIATNAAGAATFKYGPTRSWVRALTVVLANGGVLDLARGAVTASPQGHFEIVGLDGERLRIEIPAYRMPKVRKLAAGYYAAPGMDLIDLFIGAEGTLGVVTQATLGVLAPPPAWFVGLTPCRSEPAAFALADALRTAACSKTSFIDVAAVEWIDAHALALLRVDGTPARLGLTLPADADSLVLFQIAVPSDLDSETAATQLAAADDPTSDTMLGRLCRLLDRHGVLETTIPALPGDDAERNRLFDLREAVPIAVNRRIADAQRTIDPRIAKSGGDVVVPVDRLAELVARARAVCEAHGLEHAVWGHLSDGNLHPNVLPRRAGDHARAAEAQLAIGRAAMDLGGSPLSEHGVGRSPVKQALLRSLYGDDGIAAMRRVKHALDPRGVLAPGVIFPLRSV